MSEHRIVLQDLFGPRQSFDTLDWQPFRDGIEIVRIYGDGKAGPAAALLRYAKGARLPAHSHRGREHITVLAGSQRDEQGVYTAGTCLISMAGTAHSVTSDEGCVVLAVWETPVMFLDASA